MALIPVFNTEEGQYLSKELTALSIKYLPPENRLIEYMKTFDGTGAKGVIAEISLHSIKDITPDDKKKIQNIYSFFC